MLNVLVFLIEDKTVGVGVNMSDWSVVYVSQNQSTALTSATYYSISTIYFVNSSNCVRLENAGYREKLGNQKLSSYTYTMKPVYMDHLHNKKIVNIAGGH